MAVQLCCLFWPDRCSQWFPFYSVLVSLFFLSEATAFLTCVRGSLKLRLTRAQGLVHPWDNHAHEEDLSGWTFAKEEVGGRPMLEGAPEVNHGARSRRHTHRSGRLHAARAMPE